MAFSSKKAFNPETVFKQKFLNSKNTLTEHISMESSPEESSLTMPIAVEPKILTFKAKNISKSRNGPLPKDIEAKDGTIISLNEFSKTFSTKKWHPILIAEGIELEDFETLIEEDENYGKKFKYQWHEKERQYFIVDTPSKLHEKYSGAIFLSLFPALSQAFRESSNIFDFCNSPGIALDAGGRTGIPDGSVWISDSASLQGPIQSTFPFLIVEVAVSQSTASLREKISFWAQQNIPYILAIDRNEAELKATFIWMQNFPSGTTLIETFDFGDGATLNFHLSKAVINNGFNLHEYDLSPENDNIQFGFNRYPIT